LLRPVARDDSRLFDAEGTLFQQFAATASRRGAFLRFVGTGGD
jgi:hypothetical protein